MKLEHITKSEGFTRGVQALLSGTTNRKTLADQLGISTVELSKAFRRAGVLEDLRHTKLAGKSEEAKRNLVRHAPDNAKNERYAQAMDLAKRLKSVRKAHEAFPDLSYQILARKLKAERDSQTQP